MTPALAPCTLKAVSLLEGIRKDALSRIQNLTEEEALRVPEGFRNCVHWHIGHMLHVQLAHWYVRRGQALPVDPGFRKYFRDGSSPADYDDRIPAFSRLLDIYREYSFGLAEKFTSILEAPLTQPFDYMNSHFATVSDDLHLLVYHEGEHYPMVSRLLKAMGKLK
jgi:hypothetical protein